MEPFKLALRASAARRSHLLPCGNPERASDCKDLKLVLKWENTFFCRAAYESQDMVTNLPTCSISQGRKPEGGFRGNKSRIFGHPFSYKDQSLDQARVRGRTQRGNAADAMGYQGLNPPKPHVFPSRKTSYQISSRRFGQPVSGLDSLVSRYVSYS